MQAHYVNQPMSREKLEQLNALTKIMIVSFLWESSGLMEVPNKTKQDNKKQSQTDKQISLKIYLQIKTEGGRYKGVQPRVGDRRKWSLANPITLLALCDIFAKHCFVYNSAGKKKAEFAIVYLIN